MQSNFPSGAALPHLREKPRKVRRGKVGRSYADLGKAPTVDKRGVRHAGFFPTPKVWGDGAVARNLRGEGVERVTLVGKATVLESRKVTTSPDHGSKWCARVGIAGGPIATSLVQLRTVGAGPSVAQANVREPRPILADDLSTAFVHDGKFPPLPKRPALPYGVAACGRCACGKCKCK